MEGQITSALTTVLGICNAAFVLIAAISAIIVASKKLPSIDNPQVKGELINSLLAIGAIVIIVSGLIWGIPFLMGLF